MANRIFCNGKMFSDFCESKIFGARGKPKKKRELKLVKKALINKTEEAKKHEKILWSLQQVLEKNDGLFFKQDQISLQNRNEFFRSSVKKHKRIKSDFMKDSHHKLKD